MSDDSEFIVLALRATNDPLRRKAADAIESRDARIKVLEEALRGLMEHEPDYSDTLWQEARQALTDS